MSGVSKDITFRLTIDGKQFEGKLNLADEQIKGLKKSSEGVSDGMAKWGLIVTGFNQALEIGKRIFGHMEAAINNYAIQEQAVTKVRQAIESTKNAAGFTADELERVASQLQSITTFGDENILNNATAQLLTFTNIVGNNFLRTQQVAMDVATVLSEGPEQAATRLKDISIQLGKALNDPKANLSALSRAGIQFSDTQKKTINNLVETNKLYEAQSVILTELERQYGGQAMKAAQTETGKLKQNANELGDQIEILGGIAVKIITPISSAFLNLTRGIVYNFEKIEDKYTYQVERIKALDGSLADLLKRYDKLITSSKGNAEKQEELKIVINEIAELMPGAITQWNDYGEAVSLSKDKVLELLEAEKLRLKYLNKEAIEDAKENINDLKKEIEITNRVLNRGYDVVNTMGGVGVPGTSVRMQVKFSEKRYNELREKLLNLQNEIKGAEAQLKYLEGGDLPEPPPIIKKIKTNTGGGDKDKKDKTRDYYDELERLRIGNIENERRRQIELFDFERKLAKRKVDEEVKNKELATSLKIQIDKKYAKQIEEAGLLPGTKQEGKPNPLDYKDTIKDNWDLMQDAGDAVFDGLRQSSMQMWDDVFGKANSVLEQIGLRFVQIFTDKALTGIVASLFGEGEGGGNPLKALFGGALDFIPGGGFIKEIFGFAEGAIVTKPTMGVFGEAGTEGLIPLHSGKARGILADAMGAGSSGGYDFYRLEKIMENKLENFTRVMSEKQFRLNGEDLYTSGKLVSRRKNKWEM
ncbi:MAG: hypothetical protein KKB34_10195 [Bacteroidetes bacterium]|nr:hypothetical protein [Bacteroidota bacterium]